MPESLDLPNAPNLGLSTPLSRVDGDLPGIPSTSVPGNWAPVLPFGIEIGALAGFYVLDLGVDLGLTTQAAVVDMAQFGLLGIDLGLLTMGAAAELSAEIAGDSDLGEITMDAIAELTAIDLGVDIGVVTMGGVAELAPTVLTVNPDPSGSISAVAEIASLDTGVDLGIIATSAAAEIGQTEMALDLGVVTAMAAAAESGHIDLSSAYLFQPSGMNKSGTQSATTSYAQLNGWTADTANYPGSTVVSNALPAQGAKSGGTITANIPFTGSLSGTLTVRIKKNGTVIATGTGVTGTSGTATCVATGQTILGTDSYTAEILGSNNWPVVTAGAGTYLRIT